MNERGKVGGGEEGQNYFFKQNRNRNVIKMELKSRMKQNHKTKRKHIYTIS